mmetsp:Transcript_10420/g.16831  ORF Transcript_10420/g.16831 Transcript_10420/m.16831 type:complete len:266 (-) Transcript_10420:1104-1901(-)
MVLSQIDAPHALELIRAPHRRRGRRVHTTAAALIGRSPAVGRCRWRRRGTSSRRGVVGRGGGPARAAAAAPPVALVFLVLAEEKVVFGAVRRRRRRPRGRQHAQAVGHGVQEEVQHGHPVALHAALAQPVVQRRQQVFLLLLLLLPGGRAAAAAVGRRAASLLEGAGGELLDIAHQGEGAEADQKEEEEDVHILHQVLVQLAALRHLREHEEQLAAVQGGDGQRVDHGQVDAHEGGEGQQRQQPVGLRHLGSRFDDAQGAGDIPS